MPSILVWWSRTEPPDPATPRPLRRHTGDSMNKTFTRCPLNLRRLRHRECSPLSPPPQRFKPDVSHLQLARLSVSP